MSASCTATGSARFGKALRIEALLYHLRYKVAVVCTLRRQICWVPAMGSFLRRQLQEVQNRGMIQRNYILCQRSRTSMHTVVLALLKNVHVKRLERS
jgi:uncharacterized lipoprotein YajG